MSSPGGGARSGSAGDGLLFERLRLLEESLLNPGSLSEKATRITDGVVDLLGADFARIWLVRTGDRCESGCVHADVVDGPHVCRHRERCLHLFASSGRYTHLDGEVHSRVPFGCYKIGRVAAGDESGFLTNDVVSDASVHDHEWARRLGLVSFAGFKLQSSSGEPIGVLALFSQNRISAEEEALLKTLSGIASQVCQATMAEDEVRRRERYFRSLLQNLHEDILVIDRDYRIIDVNSERLISTGSTREDVVGRFCYEAIHGLSAPCGDGDIGCELQRVFGDGNPRGFQYEHVRADGSRVLVDVLHSPLRDEAGEITHVIEAIRDVTELEAAQAAARESEARFRTLYESAVDGVLLADLKAKKLSMPNRRMCEMLDLSPAEVSRLTVHDIHPEADLPRVLEAFEHQARGELAIATDIPLKRRDGGVLYADVASAPVEFAGRRCLLGIFRDATLRRRAEEERLARVRFLEGLDSVNDALRTGEDFPAAVGRSLAAVRQVFWCDRAWLLSPCDPGSGTWRVVQESAGPGVPPVLVAGAEVEMSPGFAAACRRLLASSEPLTGQTEPGAVDWDLAGEIEACTFLEMAIAPRMGNAWRFGVHRIPPRAFTNDDLRLFKEIGLRIADGIGSMLIWSELRESELKYRSLVENQPIGVIIHDMRGLILYANPAAGQILHLESADEIVGTYAFDFVRPDFLESVAARVEAAFSSGQAQPAAEEVLIRRDGSEVIAEINGAPVDFRGEPAIQVMIADITLRKQAERARQELEAQLLQSQKLEVVGQLAGGVAHDFNNILTAIVGHVSLNLDDVRMELGPDHAAVKALEEVDRASQRAVALTRQLLTFSRQDVVQPKALQLNHVLENLDRMLRRLVTENVTLEMDPDPDLQSVVADAGQIEQVIVNLVVNAVHAMPDGGRLFLETRNVSLDGDYASVHLEGEPGQYVLLAVSDTGHGMDRETRERVFEPFFSTKSREQGTGLGLSTVHGIVKRSGGHIQVYSEPDRGTTFRVYLPAADVPEGSAVTEVRETGAEHGQGTILLCEDDQAVRDLAVRILEAAGYTVLPASSGLEARALVTDHSGTVDLLVTDVIMTDTDGRQLSDALQAVRPGLPTLFISGYTSNLIAHHGVLAEGVEFLSKPFTARQLLKRVREVMAAAGAV